MAPMGLRVAPPWNSRDYSEKSDSRMARLRLPSADGIWFSSSSSPVHLLPSVGSLEMNPVTRLATKAIKSGAEGRTEPLPFGIVGMPDPDRDLAPLAQLRSRHERPNRG